MSVTASTLRLLDEHWALQAVGAERRERALEASRYLLVQQSLGDQFSFTFDFTDEDFALIERVMTAYELAAVEGLDAYLYPPPASAGANALEAQLQAGAYRTFQLQRALPVPEEAPERVFHVLHLAAVAYAGERSNDLRRWLRENTTHIAVPSVADVTWDRRVLFRIFDCWTRLFRKNQWDDLAAVHEIVAGLRADQKQYEADVLVQDADRDTYSVAYQLVALYHWARATELLSTYVLQGQPANINPQLDQHFDAARRAATNAGDAVLELLLRWLHVASRRMVAASVWSVSGINSQVTQFIERLTKASQPLFELLPPQQAALQEQGLLDQAYSAVVVSLPTSGGKTVLAEFRMLQALNQFKEDRGWVAYIAPTRALVSQITRRLRRDLEPLNIHVEQLTGAVEIDAFEDALLTSSSTAELFDVLVLTPEKMSLVIRNKRVTRPLALLVLDEAQNIEDPERGLRIELLLATIKRDCASAKFLLLMPDVPNAQDLAKWLAPQSGKAISMGTSAWQPNERLVGLYTAAADDSVRAGWSLRFETLTSSPKTLHLKGTHRVGASRPVDKPYSHAEKSLICQTAGMTRVMSERGTSIGVARTIPETWSMARLVADSLPAFDKRDPEIELVQRFLRTEISTDFELIDMLDHGVAVHHAGLSEETRSLIEWLAEIGKLRVLCATTTIAQGINFPVSSVFLATLAQYVGPEAGGQAKMPLRAFWNLAGRAGRIEHDSVGVVGIAAGKKPNEVREYVSGATGELISRLVTLLDKVEQSELADLHTVIHREQWADFRSYIAHLWNEKKELDAFIAESEQVLRNTFGYGVLQGDPAAPRRKKAEALLEATKRYAREISAHDENATLADATGFSPEGVRNALLGLSTQNLGANDWKASNLFGNSKTSILPQLIGVMMHVPQIADALRELGGAGMSYKRIAEVAQAWVAGVSIRDIAKKYFKKAGDENLTDAITNACKGIYRTLTNVGTWGLAALSKMPTSGLDYDAMSEEERRALNMLPAMLYHGVSTESAVLMRMNHVPRTIATTLGKRFEAEPVSAQHTSRHARDFLRALTNQQWSAAVPKGAAMSGADYRDVWRRLSGENLS